MPISLSQRWWWSPRFHLNSPGTHWWQVKASDVPMSDDVRCLHHLHMFALNRNELCATALLHAAILQVEGALAAERRAAIPRGCWVKGSVLE